MASSIKDFAIGVKIKAFDEVSKVFSGIGANVAKIQNKINAANAEISKYSKETREKSEAMESGLGKLGELVTIAGIIGFAHEASDAYNEMAAAVANVQSGLIATKNSAGKSLDSLKESAEGLMKSSIFRSDDILQHVTAQLLTFTRITGSNFDLAQKSIVDMTTKIYGLNASGNDLQSVSSRVARALNDPLKGLSGLSRMGITFTRSQEKMIRYFALSGQTAKAQSVIIEELQKRFGGSAAFLAETAAGKEKEIANELHASMEKIGKDVQPIEVKILSFAGVLIDKLSSILDWAEKNKTMIMNVGGAILAFAGTIFVLNKAMAAWTALQEALSMGELINNVIAATKGLKGMAAVQAVLNVIMDANPVGLIVTGIALLAAAAFLIIKNWKPISQFFVKLWKGITGAFSKAWGFISKLLDNPVIRTLGIIFLPFITIPLLIIKNWKAISSFFINIWKDITKAVGDAFSFIGKALDNRLVRGILAVVMPFIGIPVLIVKNWKRISDFFGHLFDGITDTVSKGASLVSGFFGKIWDGIRDAVQNGISWIWKALDNKIAQKILAVFMPIVGLPVLIMKNWKGITNFFAKLFDDILKLIPEPLKNLFNLDKASIKVPAVTDGKLQASLNPSVNTSSGALLQASGPVLTKETVVQKKETTQNQQITVKFDNMPKGTRIDTSKGLPGLNLSMGYMNAGL